MLKQVSIGGGRPTRMRQEN